MVCITISRVKPVFMLQMTNISGPNIVIRLVSMLPFAKT